MFDVIVAIGSTLEGKEDLLLSGVKLVLSDPSNKVLSLFYAALLPLCMECRRGLAMRILSEF